MILLLLLLGYPWPLLPQGVQHRISGTFCEYRSGPPPHFHNGVDIPLPEGGYVIASESGEVLWLSSTGANCGIRVGRFAYVHVIPRPDLSLGDWVEIGDTIGTTNWLNHIHFKDGGGASGLPCINPLLPGNLEPFQDTFKPVIDDIVFVVDGTTEVLGDTIVGRVDIFAPARDTTDLEDTNNGIYRIGYLILNEDTLPVTDTISPFKFDTLPDNSCLNYVYAPGSNTSYYIYQPTNNFCSNNFINTADFIEGRYYVEVIAEDVRGMRNFLMREVYIEVPDTVPPDAPVLLSTYLDQSGYTTLIYRKPQSQDLKGYRIYVKFLSSPWTLLVDESTLGPLDTVYTIETPLLSGTPFYFRVTSVDTATPPNESEFSNTLSAIYRESTLLLLYLRCGDEDSAVFIWTEALSPFALTLEGAREEFLPIHPHIPEVIFAEAGMRKDSILHPETLSFLKNFLNSERKFFISGGNIAEFLMENDSLFLLEYLGAGFSDDSSLSDSVRGIEGTQFEGIEGTLSGLQDLDIISPNTGMPVLDYIGVPCYAGIQSQNYDALTFTFPLERFIPDSTRDSLFRIVALTMGLTMVSDAKKGYEYTTFLYPNPSKGIFYLNRSIENFSVFDIAGRIVLKGERRARVINLKGFPSGIYFLKAKGKVYRLIKQ